MSLVVRWLEIEKSAGRPLTEILSDLNAACGTKYKHNWLAQVVTRPSQNLPILVRQYMMRKVLPEQIVVAGGKATPKILEALVKNLT